MDVKSLHVGNNFGCGKLRRSRKNNGLWKNLGFWKAFLIKLNFWLTENVLDQGKLLVCRKGILSPKNNRVQSFENEAIYKINANVETIRISTKSILFLFCEKS